MATHPSILAWRMPRTEEPGDLQSMGSKTIGPDRTANTLSSLLPEQNTTCACMLTQSYLLNTGL